MIGQASSQWIRLLPLLLLVASPAEARDVWFAAQAGWSTYFSNDFKWDASFEPPVRAAVGVQLNSRASLGLVWERFDAIASTPQDTTMQKQIEKVLGLQYFDRDDPSTFADERYGLGADAFLLDLEISEEEIASVWLGYGLALGLLIPRGDVALHYPMRPAEVRGFEGHALMFEGYAVLEAYPVDFICLTTLLGLRWANVDRLKIEGKLLRDASGSTMHIDYSGIFVLLGVKVRIGIPN